MKKQIAKRTSTKSLVLVVILTLCLALLLSACAPAEQPDGEGNTELSGTLEEIMNEIIAAAEYDFPQPFVEDVTADSASSYLGLTAEQFNTYVQECYALNAAITTQAHLMALVKCTDATAAATVKGLIADNFDSGRWICVMPEQSFVVDSGSYVLLASTYNDAAEAIKTGFAAVAGDSAGEVDVFYTGAE